MITRGLDSVDFPNWTFQLNFRMIDGGFAEIRLAGRIVPRVFVESTVE